MALLVLIIVLAVHSGMLSGAGEGIAFYLMPDFARAKEAGLGNVITAAMNQAFFTLSLGIGAMEIFGSYMSKEHTLPNVFVNMAGGRIWGALFFLFMTFASFSTVIAVFESFRSGLSFFFYSA